MIERIYPTLYTVGGIGAMRHFQRTSLLFILAVFSHLFISRPAYSNTGSLCAMMRAKLTRSLEITKRQSQELLSEKKQLDGHLESVRADALADIEAELKDLRSKARWFESPDEPNYQRRQYLEKLIDYIKGTQIRLSEIQEELNALHEDTAKLEAEVAAYSKLQNDPVRSAKIEELLQTRNRLANELERALPKTPKEIKKTKNDDLLNIYELNRALDEISDQIDLELKRQ